MRMFTALTPIRAVLIYLTAGLIIVAGAMLSSGVSVTDIFAQTAQVHGIGFAKGCVSPTNVGAPYSCAFAVQNSIDEAHDTLTFTSLIDTVNASTPVTSGNLLPSLVPTVYTDGAFCQNNASGTPTVVPANGTGSGAVKCTLPFGSQIDFAPISHYTVKANDPNPVTDTGQLTWQDLCNGTPTTNCVLNPLPALAQSQSLVQTLTPTNTPVPVAGCSPGYWKQPQHFGSYPSPLTPNTSLATAFGLTAAQATQFQTSTGINPNETLLQALSTGGGGDIADMRHIV